MYRLPPGKTTPPETDFKLVLMEDYWGSPSAEINEILAKPIKE